MLASPTALPGAGSAGLCSLEAAWRLSLLRKHPLIRPPASPSLRCYWLFVQSDQAPGGLRRRWRPERGRSWLLEADCNVLREAASWAEVRL